jgi:magnesium-protoporphyrin O-methyltransferase
VAGCCDSRGWERAFGPRFARHVAARYRKRGLDRNAQRMVDWLGSQGIAGATVLDIGGGVGELGIDLLRHGAARATTLELSRSYDAPAAALAAETGLADRVDRRIGDIAADGSVAEAADIVVLHRVVCCYPDGAGLLSAAADHAGRAVVLSHPARNAFTLALLAFENLGQRVLCREYRAFVHEPEDMVQVLRDHGFTAEHVHHGPVWRVLTARRTTPRVAD